MGTLPSNYLKSIFRKCILVQASVLIRMWYTCIIYTRIIHKICQLLIYNILHMYLDVKVNQDMVHTTEQQILLI